MLFAAAATDRVVGSPSWDEGVLPESPTKSPGSGNGHETYGGQAGEHRSRNQECPEKTTRERKCGGKRTDGGQRNEKDDVPKVEHGQTSAAL